jgi:hypothetical protein
MFVASFLFGAGAERNFKSARQLSIRYVAEAGCISGIASEDNVELYAYVASVNLHRRRLTPAQQRELIDGLLKEKPERSDRETPTQRRRRFQ